MNFLQLLTLCEVETLAMETQGYNSYLPKDNYVLQIEHDGGFRNITYIQIVNPKIYYEEDSPTLLIIQVDDNTNDPFNTNQLDNLNIKVYKLVE